MTAAPSAAAAGTLGARASVRLAREFELGTVLAESATQVRFVARARREPQRELELTVVARPLRDEVGDARLAHTLELWASVVHPGVVPVIALGASDDLRWVATPSALDRSLALRARAGRTPSPSGVMQIADGTCAALQAAHDVGLVHGSLSPEHIVLQLDGRPAIGGFGIAGAGPPAIDAPSAATDVVALARVLGEMLTLAREPHRRSGGGLDGLEAVATLLARVGSGVDWSERPATPRALAHQMRAATRVTDASNAHDQLSSLLMVGPSPARPRARRLALAFVAVTVVAIAAIEMGRGQAEASDMLAPLARARVEAPVAPRRVEPDPLYEPPGEETGAAAIPEVKSAAPAPPRARVEPRAAPRLPARSEPAVRPALIPPPRTSFSDAPGPSIGLAHLDLSSRPWGRVLVDGARVGETPLSRIELVAGVHRIRVEREGFVAFDTTVTVGAGDAIRLIDIILQRSPP